MLSGEVAATVEVEAAASMEAEDSAGVASAAVDMAGAVFVAGDTAPLEDITATPLREADFMAVGAPLAACRVAGFTAADSEEGQPLRMVSVPARPLGGQ